ncbi:hypothetical protein ACOSQ4_004003 [Xanthoceras sorbifolium]
MTYDGTFPRGNLILYDLKNQEAIDLGIPWAATKVYRYNKSLVSVKRENNFSDVFDIPWHVLGVIEIQFNLNCKVMFFFSLNDGAY